MSKAPSTARASAGCSPPRSSGRRTPVQGTLGAENARQQGREIVEGGFAQLEPALADHDFAAGDRFTIAEAALF